MSLNADDGAAFAVVDLVGIPVVLGRLDSAVGFFVSKTVMQGDHYERSSAIAIASRQRSHVVPWKENRFGIFS